MPNSPWQPYWLEDRLVSSEAFRRARVPNPAGCCTTARVVAGRALFADAHVRRLRRDARALGLPEPDADTIRSAFDQLGRACFDSATGVIRLSVVRGGPQLAGEARPLGRDRMNWTSSIAPFPHLGPGPLAGIKPLEDPTYERAKEHAMNKDVDEALLFDSDGWLVEGARSCILLVTADGTLRFPDPALGAVASIGLAAARDHLIASLARPARLSEETVKEAREVIALNAVRGARAIVRVADTPIGAGQPGPVAEELAGALGAAPAPDQSESLATR